ncbi:MAG: hypothetical protein JMJ93_10235 [Synergistaceae bacterium]|nr:hypothetical protein [Synergistaceae bacterium]
MLSRLFGQYLLQERLVTPSQLSHAMAKSAEAWPFLGILALAEGLMTPGQVEETHETQRREDRRFGEIAVERGYLTVENVESLLSRQQSRHILLGQILIEEGIFSHEGFIKALEAYRRDSGLSRSLLDALDRGDVDDAVASLFAGLADEDSFLADYVTLFVRSVIRFVDPGVAIDPLAETPPSDLPAFRQVLSGDRDLTVILCGDEEVLLDLAGRYSRMKLDGFDELAQASVGEFLNLVNGLFSVNCSDRTLDLDMAPQEQVPSDDPIRIEERTVHVPLRLPSGLLHLSLY